jgi:hypothetical protein
MYVITPCLLCLLTGCGTTSGFTMPWSKPEPKLEIPKDTVVITDRGLEREPILPVTRQQMEAAKYLFDTKKYAEAEVVFHRLGIRPDAPPWWDLGLFPSEPKHEDEEKPDLRPDPTEGSEAAKKAKQIQAERDKKRVPRAVREYALFYEAECQRIQKKYRAAVDTYTMLLTDFTRTQYTLAACKGLFEIADYWLEPTRRQMDEYQEQLQGKRWMVTPALYMHFGDDMPILDAEGSASSILNTIRLHDIKGDLGMKSLLYLGTVNFFRREYKDADFYFTQLYQEYPNCPYAARAIKQSVICKQLSTGGSVYDLRPVEESKKLLYMAQGAYPELKKEEEWIRKQLVSINVQQADRDYKIAEFYHRTGHPGAAYFYFELVRRRYPGTSYSTQAAQKMNEIKGQVDHERSKSPTPPTAAPPTATAAAQNPLATPQPDVAPPPRTLPQLGQPAQR